MPTLGMVLPLRLQLRTPILHLLILLLELLLVALQLVDERLHLGFKWKCTTRPLHRISLLRFFVH